MCACVVRVCVCVCVCVCTHIQTHTHTHTHTHLDAAERGTWTSHADKVALEFVRNGLEPGHVLGERKELDPLGLFADARVVACHKFSKVRALVHLLKSLYRGLLRNRCRFWAAGGAAAQWPGR